MISLFKDLFNPINWWKLFKNPKKIKVLYLRLFSYPGMNFKNIRIKILRNLYKNFLVTFLNFIARKNKNLNYFFFSDNLKTIHNSFELKDVHGNNIPMHGNHLSFSVIFSRMNPEM